MHPLARELDKNEKKMKCDQSCKNYMIAFDHRDSACCLSDVYSVKRGELCAIHTQLKVKNL